MTKNKIIPLTKEIPAVELNAEGKLRGGFQAMSLNSGSNITGGPDQYCGGNGTCFDNYICYNNSECSKNTHCPSTATIPPTTTPTPEPSNPSPTPTVDSTNSIGNISLTGMFSPLF